MLFIARLRLKVCTCTACQNLHLMTRYKHCQSMAGDNPWHLHIYYLAINLNFSKKLRKISQFAVIEHASSYYQRVILRNEGGISGSGSKHARVVSFCRPMRRAQRSIRCDGRERRSTIKCFGLGMLLVQRNHVCLATDNSSVYTDLLRVWSSKSLTGSISSSLGNIITITRL